MSVSPNRRRRRRRRSHSSAIRRTPEQLRQHRHRRTVGRQELLACGAVVVVCIALIALIWINTARAVQAQSADARVRVETMVTADARIMAQQVFRDLTGIEQSLTLLQSSWDTNPQQFNLDRWRSVLPILTDVADDIFIANDKHIIVQDVIPQAVGQGIGSAYANFANGSLEPVLPEGTKSAGATQMLVGELGPAGIQRQYVMYLIRPLTSPAGWLIGASYKASGLAHLFATASLGMHGVAALIDTRRGGVQAVVGSAALRPRLNINDTPMYKAITGRSGGVWIGPTAIDGVDRIHAVERVPGRDLMVVIGVSREDALESARSWADGADSVAFAATILVVLIGIAVSWELLHLRANRRRSRAVAQAQLQLEALQTDLETARSRAGLSAAQLQAMLQGTSDGVAVFDDELRLIASNPRFAAACGVAAEAVQEGMPLDELVRQQATAGAYGTLEDIEAEVARRVTQLRSGEAIGLQREGADTPAGSVRAYVLPVGGLLLIVGAATLPLTHEPEAAAATEEV